MSTRLNTSLRFVKRGLLVRNKLSMSVTVRFFRQLAWLFENDTSLANVVASIQEAAVDVEMKRLLQKLGEPSNGSLAEWLGNAPDIFPLEVIHAVRYAEEQQKISACLDMLASDLFRKDVMEDGGRGILFYPAALMLVMCMIGVIYSIFVLPAFQNMFDSFGAELPLSTRMALTMGDWLIFPLLVLTCLVVATVMLSNFGKRATVLHRMGMALTQRLLTVIGYRQFRTQLVWGRVTRIAAASLQYELDSATMLRAAAAYTLDETEAGLLLKAAEGLSNKDLSGALLDMQELPDFIREMLVIGLRTNRLGEALAFSGTIATELTLNKIGVMRQRFEVTAAIVMGLFVGFMVIAMYLPIFKMGQVVG